MSLARIAGIISNADLQHGYLQPYKQNIHQIFANLHYNY